MKNQGQNATQEVATIEKTENGITVVDLNGNLPDLSKAEQSPFDLMADYWTPENKGESKRVYFDKIATRTVLDQQSGQQIELECAYFIESENGTMKTVTNGSKRLVGALEGHKIPQGTPLLITFLGKKKNATNQFMSDNWSIRPLRIAI